MYHGLYLGSLGAATNKSALESLNITHILTVANSLPPIHANGFVYKIVDIPDREDINISQYLDDCFEFIHEAKKKGDVLSLSQALIHVRSKRPVASPNYGFMSQLRNFEKRLEGNSGKR